MRRMSYGYGAAAVLEPPRARVPAASAARVRPHPLLIALPFALALVGLVFQASVAIAELLRSETAASTSAFWKALRPVVMQLLWLGIGGVVMGITALKRGRFWISLAWLALLLGLVGLLWLELRLPNTVRIQGATRWIGVSLPGLGSFTIQPAEFYKLATLLWFVAIYGATRPRWTLGTKLGTLLWLLGIALIVRQPDKDTAGLVFLIGFVVAFLGGMRWRNVMLVVLSGVLIGGALVITPVLLSVARNEPLEQQPGAYVVKRVLAMLNPEAYAQDAAYQMLRAKIAVGSGGLWGVGIGEGREKRHLPAAENDYIFATIAEETGLVGSLAVLGMLALLVWACFDSGARAPTRAGRLYLFGLGCWIGIGALMNIGMATGLLPTMGLPLPFVSAGGSALVSLMAAIGIGVALMRDPL